MTRVYFTDRDLGNQFPDVLAAAGLTVERHRDHFLPNCPDVQWLGEVGRRGWIAITHNSRIRYTPNELRAVVDHGVALLVVVGKARYVDLAHSFVATVARIDTFLDVNSPPFIAKVYRASVSGYALPGRIENWYPRSK